MTEKKCLDQVFLERQEQESEFSNEEITKLAYNILNDQAELHKEGITYPNLTLNSICQQNDKFQLDKEGLEEREKNLAQKYLQNPGSDFYISPYVIEQMFYMKQDKEMNDYNDQLENAWSLGLVQLEVGLMESVQAIYDKREQKFSVNSLKDLMNEFHQKFEKDNTLLCCILDTLLIPQETKRGSVLFLIQKIPNYLEVENFFRMQSSKNSDKNSDFTDSLMLSSGMLSSGWITSNLTEIDDTEYSNGQPLDFLIKYKKDTGTCFTNEELTRLAYELFQQAQTQQKDGSYFHGNIRPSTVFYNKDTSSWVLQEKSITEHSEQIQLSLFKNKEDLYHSPEYYNYIRCQSEKITSTEWIDELKCDSFAIGLIILEAGLLLSIQDIYNKNLPIINENRLKDYYLFFEGKYKKKNVLVCDMLNHVLQMNNRERDSCEDLLKGVPSYKQILAHFQNNKIN